MGHAWRAACAENAKPEVFNTIPFSHRKYFACAAGFQINSTMRKLIPLTLLALTPLFAKTKKFTGAWFEIAYPAEFAAQGSIASSGVPEKFDSAFFTAPDKSVRFYIFSPQWGGESPDIALNKEKETEVAGKIEKKNGHTRRWYTIKPKGKGKQFTRSYVETTNDEGSVRWVVGIEYASDIAYKKHLDAYLKFKASLKQYAD